MPYITQRRNARIHVAVLARQNLSFGGACLADHVGSAPLPRRVTQLTPDVDRQRLGQGNPGAFAEPLNFFQQVWTILLEKRAESQRPLAQLVSRYAVRGRDLIEASFDLLRSLLAMLAAQLAMRACRAVQRILGRDCHSPRGCRRDAGGCD